MKILERLAIAKNALIGKAAPYDGVDEWKRDNGIDPQPKNKLKEQKKKGRTASDFPELRQVFRTHQDIKTLIHAMSEAESTTYNREFIHQIYRHEVLDDLHVSSQWNNRKMKTKKREFGIFLKDSPDRDDEMTKLFKKTWFTEFMDSVLDSRAWGFSLIELFNWNKESQRFEKWRNPAGMIADPVTVVNHDFVKPETGYIVQQPGLLKGLDYQDPKYKNQLLFVGNKKQGFLWKLAKMVLFKNNGISNWSEWIEVFGIDALVVKSETRDTERQELLSSLKKFATSRLAVIDTDEEIDTVGSTKVDAHKVFEMLARYVDESISKEIFGQDVVSNNTGQVVGNVGENVANDYADSDSEFLASVINEDLLPMMTRAGYLDLSKYEFRYIDKQSTRELKDRAEVDESISRMGFQHDPDVINERYGVNVEARQVATLSAVQNKLKSMMPTWNEN